MSRSKLRSTIEICADCGASDPSWASVNRGILLCADCCSIHRSMGRHISHVKSLRQGTWPFTLLNMIQTLTVQNVNSIWEHYLLDTTAPKHLRRKPQSKDSLHPTKSEFILAKHLRLAYVLKARKDEPISELGRQLHSAVRSGSLDTSMRLLAQGADPNYFNQEKGTTCLHVACRAGHPSQAELLIAWGADPNTRDSNGNSPADCARQGGHAELAERMVELVYEVTDRLIYFLSSKKPDHSSGQHFLIPEISDSNEMTDVAKAARGKLQLLPNHLFEELVMDIYDEVDRRETEAVWLTSAIGLERCGVAFLPVNPALSAPRNQGRQKLARLSVSEMASLIRDVLIDATRRQHIATLKPQAPTTNFANVSLPAFSHLKYISQLSDDEPLYDSVCSDDDYASLLPIKDKTSIHFSPKVAETVSTNYNASIPMEGSAVDNNGQNIAQTRLFKNNAHAANIVNAPDQNNELSKLKRQLDSKESTISELQYQVKTLQSMVERLTHENCQLKTGFDDPQSISSGSSPPTRDLSSCNKLSEGRPETVNNSFQVPNKEESTVDGIESKQSGRLSQRPASMYETREGLKPNWQITKLQLTNVGGLDRGMTQSMINSPPPSEELSSNLLPSALDVNKHTEKVTRCIQELWGSMQDPQTLGESIVKKSDNIRNAVARLSAIFPEKCNDGNISIALCQLTTSCDRLCVACAEWSVASGMAADASSLHLIRTSAYDLAKAAKLLVTHFQVDNM